MNSKESAGNVYVEHPLGILCRCAEYRGVTEKFQMYTVSTLSPVLPRFEVDPELKASEKIIWIPKTTEKFRENEQPFVFYCEEGRAKIQDTEVEERRWIPVKTDVISPKYIRPNRCYLHQSHLNTQSADRTTLTDMLPHRGRAVKRRDIPWGVGSHKTAMEMTDNIETRWGRVSGCFSPWADAFTISMSCPPF